MVTALVVVLALTLLAPLFSLMPQATLGAIVIFAASGLLKPREFRRISAVRARDGVLALAALLAVPLLGALNGILVAALLSLLTLLYQANHPRIDILVRKPGTTHCRPLDADAHPDDEAIGVC